MDRHGQMFDIYGQFSDRCGLARILDLAGSCSLQRSARAQQAAGDGCVTTPPPDRRPSPADSLRYSLVPLRFVVRSICRPVDRRFFAKLRMSSLVQPFSDPYQNPLREFNHPLREFEHGVAIYP
jgi:hypothetical protein